jgi:hypothetical protein
VPTFPAWSAIAASAGREKPTSNIERRRNSVKPASEMKNGDRVQITAIKPDGTPHPHAGKTGVLAEVFITVPRVTVLLDQGQEQGGTYAVVSRECVRVIP